MALIPWTPLRELDLMERRMRRLFEDVGIFPATVPAADVYETDDELVVELEVPGYDERELTLEVGDHTLTVKGRREESKKREEHAFRLHERLESSFERHFTLPTEVAADKVSATFEKGVLEIHAPKAKEAIPQRIAIKKRA